MSPANRGLSSLDYYDGFIPSLTYPVMITEIRPDFKDGNFDNVVKIRPPPYLLEAEDAGRALKQTTINAVPTRYIIDRHYRQAYVHPSTPFDLFKEQGDTT